MRADIQSNGRGDQPPSIATEVVPAQKRRVFSAAEKQRILRELDQCKRGEAGAIYRREGLYASAIAAWRKEQTTALAPRKRGPKPLEDAALRKENQRLERRVAELEQTLRQAETIMEIQKNYPGAGHQPVGGKTP